MIELTGDNALEAGDSVLELDVLAGKSGELFGHEERLREEAGDAARPAHDELVLFTQLVHTENGDDVLQRLVSLKNALHTDGDLIVPGSDILRIQDAARAVQRIHGRIDAELRDRTRE